MRKIVKAVYHRVLNILSIVVTSKFTLKLFAHSRLLSALYNIVLSTSFWREQQAVLYGRLKYQMELDDSGSNHYLLRRNIHGLEKGLLMQPRRNIFALEYIGQTVESYNHLVSAATSNLPKDISNLDELTWARDVLEEYFSATDNTHPIIDSAKCMFSKTELAQKSSNTRYIPYKRDLLSPPLVSYNALLALAQQRRSVRWFSNKPVERLLIDQALDIAKLSPSACNRQPYQFYIFDQPDLVRQLARLPIGTGGFSHNIPVIAVVVGRLRAYPYERDRHIIYIDSSLAIMSFMYALETLGISSCSLNWPDIEVKEKQISNLLNLEADERVIMLIALGYPDPEGMVAYSQKKPLSEIRRYNLE